MVTVEIAEVFYLVELNSLPIPAARAGCRVVRRRHGFKARRLCYRRRLCWFSPVGRLRPEGLHAAWRLTFETSGQLVMQTAIGGMDTLVGPLVGAAVGGDHSTTRSSPTTAPTHMTRAWSPPFGHSDILGAVPYEPISARDPS